MPVEGGNGFRWQTPNPRREGKTEGGEKGTNFGAFRLAVIKYLKDGTSQELAKLLRDFPQRDPSDGSLNYLFTSGWAVEALTHSGRVHHDIDVVDMKSDAPLTRRMDGIDIVTPEHYWARMNFTPEFLEKTARKVRFYPDIPASQIEIVHPAIILAQKSSNAFGRNPRIKDDADVASLLKYLKLRPWEREKWIRLANIAIDALPNDEERNRTRGRLFGTNSTPRR